MTIQPKFHWQFAEREGTLLRDTISGVEGSFHQASLIGHGRIGNAIRLNRKDSRVNLGKVVGQFGTNDFTVAFGIKITNIHKQNDLNIIGNRNVGGHGNWFSLRLEDKGRILTFEVDENNKGKNYAVAKTQRLSISDKKWHHIAIVREARSMRVYFDGALMVEGSSKTGVANIKSGVDTKIGHWTRHTPTGQIEDLRIYSTALSTLQIQNLIPPARQFLQAGEIELIAADNAAVILKQDIGDLSRLSPQFQKLRLGPGMGVTLYKGKNFSSASQKLSADLPEIRHSRLKSFPGSIRIRSTAGEPFSGKWVIKAPNGKFLSQSKSVLTTTSKQSFNALFKMHQHPQLSRTQLIHGPAKKNTALKVAGQEPSIPLFVENLADREDEFFITNQANNQWAALNEENTFNWTKQKDDRTVFIRTAKMAENEGQVGELVPGEVALYEHVAYHGRTWILSDSQKDSSGSYQDLSNFQGLHDQTSSIQLGPNTGATLFKHLNFHVAPDKREKEIEDILKSAPNLIQSQIGNDSLSSLKVFKKIAPQNIFSSFSSKLSQDYRMVDDKLEEFSSYRTILRFEPGAGEVEVSATDLTTIEVDGTIHEIDEVRSVILTPNAFNLIMITSEADGIHTPGLKFRTSDMAENERVVIFPNQEVHQKIANLEDGALWNGMDSQGNLIVDREARSKEEVAQVQNTIQRVMTTVTYPDASPLESLNGHTPIPSTEQVVSSATIDKPWELKWATIEENNATLPNTSRRQDSDSTVIVKAPIEEKTISADEWAELVSQATTIDATDALEIFGRVGRKIKNTFKKAASVVIGKVKDVVHVIVKTAEGIVDIIVDTVEKIAAVVESIVERVVKAIKQFIEFLQFLFGWDDILETQRYLKRAINSGLDSAVQLTETAKPHVKSFVDDLQEGVEDGMNVLVEALGGEPSEVEDSGFEFPEALEWFLSKLLGGPSQSTGGTIADSGSDNSPLGSFLRNLIEALEDVIGAGFQIAEGVFESFESLITNPSQPERALIIIIEAFRDAIIEALDAVENVALGLLDVVQAAVDLLKTMINAEIRIPFISDLLDFIGLGKVTALNLSTIVLAIPVTVTAKLFTGEQLFTNNTPLPLELSNQPVAKLAFAGAAAGDIVTESAALENTEDPLADQDSRDELLTDRNFTIIVTVADTVNHLLNATLDLFDVPQKDNVRDPDVPTTLQNIGAKAPSIGILTGLEFASLLLGFTSWSFSPPDPEDKREFALWSYRGAQLILDTIFVMKLTGKQLRRVGNLSVFWTILSAIDLILYFVYLEGVDEENLRIKRAEISNEIVSAVPNFIPIFRENVKDPISMVVFHLGHVAVDTIAAVTTGVTGGILIDEANKAL